MTSHKQTRANRSNAKRSTGPTSERGKNTVRHNSLTHGLRAQTVLLPDEDQEAFEGLRQGLRDYHRPIGEQEDQLVDLITMYTWRLGRAARVEAGIFNHYSRKIADLHAARLLESPEADPLAAAVEKAQRDLRVGLAKKIMIEQELTNREPSARDPAPDDGDTVPPSPEGGSETEVRERLHTGLQQATCDVDEARVRLNALAAMQAQTVARNTEVAVCGAPVGEAFVADAMEAGALDKLSRYEKTLMNNLDKAMERLAELQDGRVEQAPDGAEA